MKRIHIGEKTFWALCTSLFFFTHTISVCGAVYEYDQLGRVTQVVYEDGSCVTYVYDANGNIVETSVVAADEIPPEDQIDNRQNGVLRSGGYEAQPDEMTGEKTSIEDVNEEGAAATRTEPGNDIRISTDTEEQNPNENIEEDDTKNRRVAAAAVIATFGIAGIAVYNKKKRGGEQNEEK